MTMGMNGTACGDVPGERACSGVASAASGSDSTMAEGLTSAAAVGAPAQDASTIGNAPASVKACAKPLERACWRR